MRLPLLGWQSFFLDTFQALEASESLVPGRVARASRGILDVITARGEIRASLPGTLRHRERQAVEASIETPVEAVVGDWVALPVEGGRIAAILPRKTRIARKRPGREATGQVLASNVDVAIIVAGLDREFNLRRVERFLVVAAESGVRPIVVLNKADLAASPWAIEERVRQVAGEAPILLTTARDGVGLETLSDHVAAGETAVLLGSSGVGKSTIVNRLLGREAQPTQPVRASDSRGRHTTTHRELLVVPGGWVLIDTPGLRELQPWAGGETVEEAFDDIARHAEGCRFRDCAHRDEPGCAVVAAIEAGEIDPGRLAGYHKLTREAGYLEARADLSVALERKNREKRLHRIYRNFPHRKR